jgi:hypothetical protein
MRESLPDGSSSRASLSASECVVAKGRCVSMCFAGVQCRAKRAVIQSCDARLLSQTRVQRLREQESEFAATKGRESRDVVREKRAKTALLRGKSDL